MKKYSTKLNRMQLEVLQMFLHNFTSYSAAPQASIEFKMQCALLSEIKQDIDIKIADNYRHNFKINWTAAKALAFHLMVLMHSGDDFLHSYEGVLLIRISNEINQIFA